MSDSDPVPPDPLQGWVNDDLADRLAGEERVDIDVSAADLATAEVAGVGWLERARADPSGGVSVSVLGGADRPEIQGVIVDQGHGWLLLRTSVGDVVVSSAAVLGVTGLSRRTASEQSATLAARGIGTALRGLAAHGRPAVVRRIDGISVEGTLSRVGADAVDVVLHPLDRSPRADDPVMTVPYGALATVQA